MDGYRRLERTRSVVGASLGSATIGSVQPQPAPRAARRPSRARVAGTLRLAGFVGVIALIIGTSVSLASADERTEPASSSAPAKVERASAPEPKQDEPVVERAAPEPIVEPAPAAADVVEPTSTNLGSANGSLPAASLPLTGDEQVSWFVLGGSLLVLVGMLVQVAGQPLPARTRA
jgi:LPXTG-motif cell wall-anchored protein